jgi:hypothetical protein
MFSAPQPIPPFVENPHASLSVSLQNHFWDLTNHNKNHAREDDYLHGQARDSSERMKKHIQKLIKMINHLPNNREKKYQLMGYKEWKIMREILSNRHDVSFSLIKDNIQQMKTLKSITCYFYATFTPLFYSKKMPVLYLKVRKERSVLFFHGLVNTQESSLYKWRQNIFFDRNLLKVIKSYL